MVMNARWPTRDDYDMAMENLAGNMRELELRQGQILRSAGGVPLQYGLPDTHTCIYRIDHWIIRCFCRTENKDPDEKLIERYQALSKFTAERFTQVSALVPLQYFERGLNVPIFERNPFNRPTALLAERVVPIVKMPFVHGPSLGAFIAAKHENTSVMRQLGAAWLRMIREMEDASVVHGDLDLTNVRVQENPIRGEITLKLIDYDNTWIPDFRASNDPFAEFGHEDFQHPRFIGNKSIKFGEAIDRFAALVISISIQLLIAFPEYYETWQMSENKLVFSSADYKAEQQGRSERLYELRNLQIPGLEPYIEELASCLHDETIIMLRSLSSIAEQGNRASSIEQEAPEQIAERPDFHPQHSREVVIPDWSSRVYIDRSQPRPSTAPPPSPAREQPTMPTRTPVVQQPEYHEPTLQVQLTQPAQPLPAQNYAPTQAPVEAERQIPAPPAEDARYMAPQEPLRLDTGNAGDTYDPYAGTHRVDEAGLPIPPLMEKEKPAQQIQHRQRLRDPATRLGLGTILLILLFIIIIILLIANLVHGHSGSLSPTIHLAVTLATTGRVALAPFMLFRGGGYVA